MLIGFKCCRKEGKMFIKLGIVAIVEKMWPVIPMNLFREGRFCKVSKCFRLGYKMITYAVKV